MGCCNSIPQHAEDEVIDDIVATEEELKELKASPKSDTIAVEAPSQQPPGEPISKVTPPPSPPAVETADVDVAFEDRPLSNSYARRNASRRSIELEELRLEREEDNRKWMEEQAEEKDRQGLTSSCVEVTPENAAKKIVSVSENEGVPQQDGMRKRNPTVPFVTPMKPEPISEEEKLRREGEERDRLWLEELQKEKEAQGLGGMVPVKATPIKLVFG